MPERDMGESRAANAPLFWLTLAAGGWLVWVIVASAWQCDDAFIAFRTADNLWNGLGLVWNPGERVQSYTSPLWLGVAVLARGVTGELYFSMLVVSIGLAVAAAGGIAWRVAPDFATGALALLALSCSAAFVDFATSGLEGPLLYLLLALLLAEARRPDSKTRVLRTASIACAVALTRLDAALVAAPLLLWVLARQRPRREAFARALAGFAPLFAWECFSLVYYGSLVPNTAWAKLNLQIDGSELAARGVLYLFDSLRHDPISLGLVAAGVIAALRKGTAADRWLAAGVALYLLYVVRIGGDFMSGRFVAAPALIGCGLLVSALPPLSMRRLRFEWPPPPALVRAGSVAAVVGALVLYGLAWPASPWWSGPDHGAGLARDEIVRKSGIADERAYYYPTTGLLRVWQQRDQIERRNLPVPPYRGAIAGRVFQKSPRRVKLMDEVGFFAYFAGPEKTVIDMWALSDPLLARLPYRPQPGWRPGHYPRRIPRGYPESIETGEMRIVDRDVAALYTALDRVSRGPLFARDRWREIWRLNTGYYDPLGPDGDYD
jgi:arabinofuranosyltransferase